MDYRALNAITEKKNVHALPRIDDLLNKIQGAKYFIFMDLLQGFYKLPLRESDRPINKFKTTFGHFNLGWSAWAYLMHLQYSRGS